MPSPSSMSKRPREDHSSDFNRPPAKKQRLRFCCAELENGTSCRRKVHSLLEDYCYVHQRDSNNNPKLHGSRSKDLQTTETTWSQAWSELGSRMLELQQDKKADIDPATLDLIKQELQTTKKDLFDVRSRLSSEIKERKALSKKVDRLAGYVHAVVQDEEKSLAPGAVGVIPAPLLRDCLGCDGAGVIMTVVKGMFSFLNTESRSMCQGCKGSGTVAVVDDKHCEQCGGKGKMGLLAPEWCKQCAGSGYALVMSKPRFPLSKCAQRWCKLCAGKGEFLDMKTHVMTKCPACQGGKVLWVLKDDRGSGTVCGWCRNTGLTGTFSQFTCTVCSGTGWSFVHVKTLPQPQSPKPEILPSPDSVPSAPPMEEEGKVALAASGFPPNAAQAWTNM